MSSFLKAPTCFSWRLLRVDDKPLQESRASGIIKTEQPQWEPCVAILTMLFITIMKLCPKQWSGQYITWLNHKAWLPPVPPKPQDVGHFTDRLDICPTSLLMPLYCINRAYNNAMLPSVGVMS